MWLNIILMSITIWWTIRASMYMAHDDLNSFDFWLCFIMANLTAAALMARIS